ncbi:ABC transporter substrate-binding protein [Clostridium sp.]|uniref:ABC transporter substrate-binding protein n=1 Tax=Clostridium sp. TaxID=1506 RepID=UPI0025C1A269|nr:ABC transporter substrate-binding protein [Clostridium sp.]MBS4955862.1 ABC transporter substrate-binding protein [Clostridium sp.]MDU4882016.1 ABC transporter substrate-binding protein [Clostridium celatum]MDU7075388.1 ABC transporter substrate-binding protein [Clostridium celatum]
MSRLSKRLVAMVLAASVVCALPGCSSGSSKSNGASSTQVKEDGTIDTSKFVTIKLIVLGNKPTNGRIDAVLEKINEKLKEKINANLEMQYVEWADWQTQYNLLLASGDKSIDLITTATDWLDAWPNIKKGSFLPLTEEMLKTYTPQTYANVDADDWEQCSYNGDIYLIPENEYTQYTNHGVFYRGDWAEEFGIGEIDSFEKLGQYFQGVIDNKDGVIPWDVSGTAANGNALANGYINSTTENILIDGIPVGLSTIFFGESKDDPYTVTSPYVEGDTFLEFAKLMKSWADAGYWREDVLNYDGDTRELFYSGQSGADQHHSQTFYGSVKTTMDERQPGADAQMFPFSEPSKNLVKTSITHGAVAVAANSQNPERALMVYDLLRNDEEIYKLMNYGIEGTDYIITEDGKLGYPEGYDASTDALGSNFWIGRRDEFELDSITTYEGKQDMIDNYNSYAIDYPYGEFVVDTTNISSQISAMADICANYVPRIAFGKVDDPEKEVAAFQSELKAAGYDEVLAEIQSQMDAIYK